MSRTKIEWTEEIWNPVTGCTPVSIGCQNCYARRWAKRHQAMGTPGYENGFKVTFHPDRLEQPLHWRKPRRIFVCSMGDLFHEDVEPGWVIDILATIRRCKQHTFIVLTKRPTLMGFGLSSYKMTTGASFLPLSNLWLGVSVENQATADERIPELLQIPAAVRFVSCEPLLSPIDLKPYLKDLDWVIVGGETGPGWRYYSDDATVTHDWLNDFIKRHGPIQADRIKETIFPDLWFRWARDIRDQCKKAKVSFFGKKAPGGGELPPNLKIRQWPRERGADGLQLTADSKKEVSDE